MTTKNNVIDIVNSALLDYIHEDNSFARDYLEDNGIDSILERSRIDKELKKRFTLARGNEKRMKDKSLLNQVIEQIRSINLSRKNESSENLQGLLASSGFGLQFRNLDKWSDEEMREALSDVDLIKLLEKLKDIE